MRTDTYTDTCADPGAGMCSHVCIHAYMHVCADIGRVYGQVYVHVDQDDVWTLGQTFVLEQKTCARDQSRSELLAATMADTCRQTPVTGMCLDECIDMGPALWTLDCWAQSPRIPDMLWWYASIYMRIDIKMCIRQVSVDVHRYV